MKSRAPALVVVKKVHRILGKLYYRDRQQKSQEDIHCETKTKTLFGVMCETNVFTERRVEIQTRYKKGNKYL